MFTHQFVENVTAGTGFLALAIVIFGRWRPIGLLVAGLFFGLLKALAVQIGAGLWSLPVPRQVPEVAPYVATLLLLALLRKRTDAPAALGTPFARA
jgi:simple sugar transport system permease protein